MPDFFLKVSSDGNIKPVVEETKTLGDGSETRAEYKAESYFDMQFKAIQKIAEKMVADGFDVNAYMEEKWKHCED